MAAALRACFEDIRAAMRTMTSLVDLIAVDDDLQHLSNYLVLETWRNMPLAVRQSCKLLVPLLEDTQHAQHAQLGMLRAEHALFLTSFTALLVALVPQLDRLGSNLSCTVASSRGTAEESLFWEMWCFLFSGCLAFTRIAESLPTLWPMGEQPCNIPLCTAFHSLLVWLLPMTRSSAWIAMKPQHGLESRNVELGMILIQAASGLNLICMTPRLELLRQLSLLPYDFLPLLCCIASEQFGNAPLLVPLSGISSSAAAAPASATMYSQGFDTSYVISNTQNHIFNVLALSINNFLSRASKEAPMPFLRSPEVSQLLKVIILIPEASLPTLPPGLVPLSVKCLNAITETALIKVQVMQVKPPPPIGNTMTCGVGTGTYVSREDVRLIASYIPSVSVNTVQLDAKVLHDLCIRVEKDPEMMFRRQTLQSLILESWTTTGILHLVTPVELSEMTRSVVGLAKRAAWQGLYLLQQMQQDSCQCAGQQQQQRQQAKPQRRRPQMQQQQRKREQQQQRPPQQSEEMLLHAQQVERRQTQRIVAMNACAALAAHTAMSMTSIRHTMYISSNFQIRNPTGGMDHKAGPEYKVLNEWGAMRGWAAVTEVMHRGKRLPNNLNEVHGLALSASKCLMLTWGTSDAALLRERISLAATVRKLLWPYLQWEQPDAVSGGQRLPPHRVDPASQLLEKQKEEQDLSFVALMVATMLNGTAALNYVIDGVRSNWVSAGSHSTGAATKCDIWVMKREIIISSSKEPSTASQSGGTGINGGSGSSQGVGMGEVDRDSLDLSASLLHHMQAISYLTLVQVCFTRLDRERASNTLRNQVPDWLLYAVEVCRLIQNQYMREHVLELLSLAYTCPKERKAVVTAMWERYAMTHLNGRLLPGCCNLRCSNLQGFSESALETQLCSGCRRARYCCVECQRAAWREGGHSVVCGKQGCSVDH